jgi:hypothetical protein
MGLPLPLVIVAGPLVGLLWFFVWAVAGDAPHNAIWARTPKTERQDRWAGIIAAVILVGVWMALLVTSVHAAPLKVQANYLSPYYSRTVETLVTVDLKAKRAGTATLTARGLQLPNYAGGQRDDEYQTTVRLHKGRNHFRRRFYVARWAYAIPGYGAALHPYHDRLVAEWLNAVSVVLEAGSRRLERVVSLDQANAPAALTRPGAGHGGLEPQ